MPLNTVQQANITSCINTGLTELEILFKSNKDALLTGLICLRDNPLAVREELNSLKKLCYQPSTYTTDLNTDAVREAINYALSLVEVKITKLKHEQEKASCRDTTNVDFWGAAARKLLSTPDSMDDKPDFNFTEAYYKKYPK